MSTANKTSSSPRLNIANLMRIDRDPLTRTLRKALVDARKKAKTIREHVDSYAEPIFHTYNFTSAHTGEALKSSGDLYLVEDLEAPEVKAFYASLDSNLPEGHCPALTAHHEAIKAERALLQHFSKALGVEFAELYGEDREKAVQLFLNPPKRRA